MILECVPDGELAERASALAQRMARLPLNQLQMMKWMLNDVARHQYQPDTSRLLGTFDGGWPRPRSATSSRGPGRRLARRSASATGRSATYGERPRARVTAGAQVRGRGARTGSVPRRWRHPPPTSRPKPARSPTSCSCPATRCAQAIADRFLDDARCYNRVRNMLGFTGRTGGDGSRSRVAGWACRRPPSTPPS